MNLSDYLNIVVVTSLAPWQPNTWTIERAIVSMWEMLDERVRPWIICDQPPDWCTAQDRERYKDYVHALPGKDLGRVQLMRNWVGLPGCLQWFFRVVPDKKLVLNYQHDWEFITPARVKTQTLLNAMLEPHHPPYVKFSKRAIHLDKHATRRIDWIQKPIDERVFGVPLIQCSGWGDVPHFATYQHYRDLIVPMLRPENKGRAGRKGVENHAYAKIYHSIKRIGFDATHRIWGTYLYGRIDDGPYLRHLGNSTIPWRREVFGKANV